MSMVELTDTERKIASKMDPGAGQALTISPKAGGISFTNADQAMNFAKMMSLSNSGVRKHLRGNPGACLAIVVQAVEWGVSAYAVANKSYFVNDQIAFESQLVQAVILRRAPIKGRIKFDFSGSGQNRVCRAWARLSGDDDGEVVEYVSPPLKDIKPKNSPLWVNDPDQQLTYMSGRALCRRHFPDVLLGIYTPDELEAGIGVNDARSAPRRDAPLRGLQSKLDALAADDDKPPRDVHEDVIEHDVSAPANDAAPADNHLRDFAGPDGLDYDALLADLDTRLATTDILSDLAAARRDDSDWIDGAPADIKAEAEKLYAATGARIERQNSDDASESDPHAELKELARRKAAGGERVYNRWSASKSDDDRKILNLMAEELIAIAAEADKRAGRA